jgi:hypothetical protein
MVNIHETEPTSLAAGAHYYRREARETPRCHLLNCALFQTIASQVIDGGDYFDLSIVPAYRLNELRALQQNGSPELFSLGVAVLLADLEMCPAITSADMPDRDLDRHSFGTCVEISRRTQNIRDNTTDNA